MGRGPVGWNLPALSRTMAGMSDFTAADLEALNRAVSRGESQVMFQGRQVTFRSVADLLAARDRVRYEIARSEGRTRSPRYARLRGGW